MACLNPPASSQVANEYSKDDIMHIKGQVISKHNPHLPYHDHGTKTLYSFGFGPAKQNRDSSPKYD